MRKYLILSIILALSICSCSNKQEDIETLEKQNEFLMTFSGFLPDYFFDQGSWFGLSLLEKELGLNAPLILSDSLGYKMKESLVKLSIEKNGKILSSGPTNSFIPGRLIQKNDTSVKIEVIYVNNQTALLECTVVNNSDGDYEYNFSWVLSSGYVYNNNRILYELSNAQMEISFDQDADLIGNNTFQTKLTIPAHQSKTQYISIRHRFNEDDEFLPAKFENIKNEFAKNVSRWYNYLHPYKKLSKEKQLLAAKCIQTLVNNWRSPSGMHKHEGLYPSYYYKYFNGFWAWDSWRHAVALTTFEPSVAKNQIRAMYDYQDEYGMIADAVWRDTAIFKPNLRNTKPPLSAWAVYSIFKADNDITFVKEMFPKLVKYHEWWYTYRDHNKNGLCEFGSTDGTRTAAAWESGMDNAVRFDSAKMVRNGEKSWSLDQESVDLNAYLCAEKQFLINLAKAIDENEYVKKFENEIPALKNKIQNRFYDENSGYFYDYNFTTDEKIKTLGPEAWVVLWAKLATDEQAKNVVKIITDTSHFNTYCPFPTLDASHFKFNPQEGYWRGPVWLDQVYLALNGMRNYGFDKEAGYMKEKLLNNAQGLLQKNEAIWENYNPVNGEGLNAKHFSWSSSHLLLLLNESL